MLDIHLFEAINALAFGVFICNAYGKVIFANAAAARLKDNGCGVRVSPGSRQISTRMASEARRLTNLIRQAAGQGSEGAMQITCAQGTEPAFALVAPLPEPGRKAHRAGFVMVTIQQAGQFPSVTADRLMALFHLSPTQAALCVDVFEGLSPTAIAARRGIKITTVRSHLAEIFVRTGTRTQRDLVRLLAALPPLAPTLGAAMRGPDFAARHRRAVAAS